MCPIFHLGNAARTKYKNKYRGAKSVQKSSCNVTLPCSYCGRSNHPRDKCPAIKSKCRLCQQTGHWDKMCKTKISKDQGVSDSRVSTLKLCVASSSETTNVSNRIEVEVFPFNFKVSDTR